MSLQIGQQIGSYEITSLIGKGGMGEVYRARDSKLKRDVAIKALPDEFSRDHDRLIRFQREAEVLASLNHSNIATIYDLQEANGSRFLIMELVEGETLAQRISRGPLPVEEALDIAKQICEALEAAHEKGIIHRDLKPANVKTMSDGKIKVLDFGLAKMHHAEPHNANLSNSPTLITSISSPGMIVGTAAYIAPEVVRGKPVDRRADIWAFGCIFFEMLTGHQVWIGETVADMVAAAVAKDPDWRLMPANVPSRISDILRRCLEKDPRKRWRDAGDVRLEIEEALTKKAGRPLKRAGQLSRSVSMRQALLMVLVAASVTALGVWAFRPVAQPTEALISRLTIPLPRGVELGFIGGRNPQLALSPNGRQLAYVGNQGMTRRLYLRSMESLETIPLPGSEDATYPFFSPEGDWIAFFAQGKLKKVSITGVSQAICDAPGNSNGGAWGPDGNVYFTLSNSSGISSVSVSGGMPRDVTILDRAKGETSHSEPQILPGGKALMFTVSKNGEDVEVHAQSLETGERHVLVNGRSAHYISTGHLVYSRANALFTVRFDVADLKVTGGTPARLSEQVRGSHYSVSESGSLAYAAGDADQNQRKLIWVDRSGNIEPLPVSPAFYSNVVISPDGRLAAVVTATPARGIWIYDFARSTLAPLVTSEGSSFAPVWAPDGRRIAYRGTRSGFQNMFWKAIDGTTSEERLTIGNKMQTTGSWSPDGKWLSFEESGGPTGPDILVLNVEDGKPRDFVRTSSTELDSRFSPDGHWVAFGSNQSGRYQIYVQPFPGPGARLQISTEGGTMPLWSREGRELFYLNGNELMAVDVITQPSFHAGRPRLLFQGRYVTNGPGFPFDISPDGRRFLMIEAVQPEQAVTQINVVINWFEELKQLASVASR
jgi:eukaryotic-like serine/threonine-protein kinase